ncbi:MAG: alpha/beta hydrolase [Candidatus Binatia bacterium]|nr:alpha/beta hydrolase [Candidatus Binatia bacterium]
MAEFSHRYFEVNGIRMHAVEAGSGFPVLLCHGFPEIWYSWRHQLRALADAGYRAIAPDQRGYGETSVPREIHKYSIHHLVGDLTSLLDALEIERAVIVGHDWGGIVTWQMALLAPHRVAGVVGVNTPFFPRLPVSPLTVMRQMAQGQFHYILYFQEPGVADAELERDVRRSLRAFYQETRRELSEAARQTPPGVFGPAGGGILDRLGDAALPPYISAEDFEVFAQAFERTGFTGALNWYRNLDWNWETTAYLSGAKVQAPALMVTAEWDPVLRPEMAAGMEQWVPNLKRTILIRGCGHWTQQEKPEEVNAALLDFLREIGL